MQICVPASRRVKFRFLSDKAENTLFYLKQMSERASQQERTPEGKGIYDVFVDIAAEADLDKTKGWQKVVNAIKRGVDVCQTLRCDTTTEMSLMMGDVLHILDDKNIKLPGDDGKVKSHTLVFDRGMKKFINRVATKGTMNRSVLG